MHILYFFGVAFSSAALAATAAFSFGGHSGFPVSSTVVVAGNTATAENQPGWMFNRDVTTSTPFEFSTSSASIGIGSLYVKPIGATAANKFVGENFLNAFIADVDSVSYDFKIGSGGDASDANQFYMNVYANFGQSDDFKFYDCRYNVVPTVGSVSGFTTVTFDPTQSYSVTTRTGGSASPFTCPAIPADMDTLSPGSNIRAIAINVGDTSANDVGLDGYLDKVAVTINGGKTTYDFEPFVVAKKIDQCKADGWKKVTTAEGKTFKNQGECIAYTLPKKGLPHKWIGGGLFGN
jgi:hypothetical protein